MSRFDPYSRLRTYLRTLGQRCNGTRNAGVTKSHPKPTDDVGRAPNEGTLTQFLMSNSPFPPARKNSIAVLSPRLVRNSKSRQRLREPLLAGFELLPGRFTLISAFS